MLAGCDALTGPWPGFPKGLAVFTWEACAVLLCWLAFQVCLLAASDAVLRLCAPASSMALLNGSDSPSGLHFQPTERKNLSVVTVQVVLHLMIPGPVEQGTQLSNGSKLKYKLTGTNYSTPGSLVNNLC